MERERELVSQPQSDYITLLHETSLKSVIFFHNFSCSLDQLVAGLDELIFNNDLQKGLSSPSQRIPPNQPNSDPVTHSLTLEVDGHPCVSRRHLADPDLGGVVRVEVGGDVEAVASNDDLDAVPPHHARRELAREAVLVDLKRWL